MILLLLLLFLFSFSSCSLGVFGRRCSSKCDAAALKAGYQAAAKASHPDRPGGSKANFQRVAAAYATLKHAKARAAYDAAQRAWRAAADAADAAAAAAADAARRAKKRGGVAEDRRSIRAKASGGGGGGLGGGGGGGDFDGDSGGGGSGVGQSSRKRGAAAAQSLFEVDPLEWYRRASGGDAMVAAVTNGDAAGLQVGGVIFKALTTLFFVPFSSFPISQSSLLVCESGTNPLTCTVPLFVAVLSLSLSFFLSFSARFPLASLYNSLSLSLSLSAGAPRRAPAPALGGRAARRRRARRPRRRARPPRGQPVARARRHHHLPPPRPAPPQPGARGGLTHTRTPAQRTLVNFTRSPCTCELGSEVAPVQLYIVFRGWWFCSHSVLGRERLDVPAPRCSGPGPRPPLAPSRGRSATSPRRPVVRGVRGRVRAPGTAAGCSSARG